MIPTPGIADSWQLATILTLSESLAEDGFEPLNIGSMRKNLSTELS